jgi:hypothetical protein
MIVVVLFAAAITVGHTLAGAKIPIDAIVLKVDRPHGRATMRFAPLDTAPGGVRVVAVGDKIALKHMWVGEAIHAIADTSRTPWIVSHIERTTP